MAADDPAAPPADPRKLAVIERLARQEHDPTVPRLPVQMGPFTAYLVVAALQLCTRHPSMSPMMNRLLEQVARQIQDRFTPDVAEILEEGWHREHDVGQGGRG